MKQEGFLRFALVMFDNNATNFNSSLSKLIQCAIFENGPSSTDEIINYINSKYSLKFSKDEINECINKNAIKVFIKELSNNKCVYNISANCRKKFEKISSDSILSNLVDRFLKSNDFGEKPDTGDIEKTISKYLYFVFNSNTNNVLSLLNGKPKNISGVEITPQEKKIIALFLDWEDDGKDKFVFNLVNASFDYCSLSMDKRKPAQAKDLFYGKKVLLDTNVILSLIGINGVQNKKSSDFFIGKCKENNLTLCYSNYTKEECEATIKSLVMLLEKYIRFENFETQDEDNVRDINSIFGLYCSWKIDKFNSGFSEFEAHLLYELKSFLYDCELTMVDEKLISINKNDREAGIKSLELYKRKNYRKTTRNSLTHDVNNYLFMKMVKASDNISIFSQKYIFVTLDRLFSEWAKNNSNGLINTIIMVDTFYSLLLRFSSRADDDFRAFNDFLKSSICYFYESEYELGIKNRIATIINNINERNDLKKQIYLESERILSEPSYFDTKGNNAEEIVDKAIDNILSDYQKEAENKEDEYKNRLNAIKQQLDEKNQSIESLIRLATKKRIFYKRLFITIMCLILILGVFTFLWLFIKNNSSFNGLHDEIGFWISILETAISVLGFSISLFLKSFNICLFDVTEDYNYKKCKESIDKKMNNNICK